MKIAVTGSKGRLGFWLTEGLRRLGGDVVRCERLRCDIANRGQVKEAVAKARPDVIINCAAWTAVDDAEKPENINKVLAVNTRGPAILRQSFDGLLVQISTGFVFDGKDGPHIESDDPNPLNIYGYSKWAGELAAQMRGPTLVVRVLDLFGPHNTKARPDFVRQIRDLLELGKDKELPDTLYGTPTYIPHLSEALLIAIDREMTGVIHIAGDLTLSRYEWGRKIAGVFRHDPDLIKPTSEIAGAAPRPLNGGLSVKKAERLGLPIYSPIDGLISLRDLERASDDE